METEKESVMERRVLWMGLLLGAALSLGCGGDDSSSDDDDDDQGESGSGGDDSGGESGAGGGMIGGEGLACGTTRCEPPEGATAEACCFDHFSSTCGMRGGFGGNACVAIVETDPRCPSVMAGPIMLASCCIENMCGITAPLFGTSDCIELSAAEQMAMDRAAMFDEGEDGGIGFDGGGGGFMLDFPDPQACE
jgi:hypothetical protein